MSDECDIFCEYCGDCQRCYGNDPCYRSPTGHHWFLDKEEND
jgi:hypothetical protein